MAHILARQSKAESVAIQTYLRECSSKIKLDISFYDTTRNEHIKERRARMEKEARCDSAIVVMHIQRWHGCGGHCAAIHTAH